MKKSWGKPIVQVQLFVPQECVAACNRITGKDIYLDLDSDTNVDAGEDLEPDGRLRNASKEDTYYNVRGYRDYEFRLIILFPYYPSSYYTGDLFPVVNVRRESGNYYAYNATS